MVTIDLGEIRLGGQIPALNFDIHNLASPFGDELTARLDLVSIDIIPAESSLTISGFLFENLAASESEQFTVNGAAEELGTFTTDFVFLLADEDLPGATSETIVLRVSYDVIEPFVFGDASGGGNIKVIEIRRLDR